MPSPIPEGSRTPRRRPSSSTDGSRTPRGAGKHTPIEFYPSYYKQFQKGSRTPRHRGGQTPSREQEIPETPSKTPRKNTPAKSIASSLDTPLRYGAPRRAIEGEQEIPASPAHSLAPTSPGTALALSEIDLSSPLNYGTPSSLGSIRTPRSGIRGTPIRMRPDVRSDKRMRQVNVGGETPLDTIPEASETDSTTPHLVIWGTNVSVAECKEKFKQFILRFIDTNAEEDERTDDMNLNEPLYLQKLEEVSFWFKSSNFILLTKCANC